jgi:hypothetical protein
LAIQFDASHCSHLESLVKESVAEFRVPLDVPLALGVLLPESIEVFLLLFLPPHVDPTHDEQVLLVVLLKQLLVALIVLRINLVQHVQFLFLFNFELLNLGVELQHVLAFDGDELPHDIFFEVQVRLL